MYNPVGPPWTILNGAAVPLSANGSGVVVVVGAFAFVEYGASVSCGNCGTIVGLGVVVLLRRLTRCGSKVKIAAVVESVVVVRAGEDHFSIDLDLFI